MLLKSTTRHSGRSTIVTIPAEVARRLELAPGQDLYWHERAPGEWAITALDDDRADVLHAHERVIERYAAVFARLAR